MGARPWRSSVVFIRKRWLGARDKGIVRGRLAEIYAEEFMSMKSLTFRFLKEILPSSAAALALLGLIGIASPARADDYTLCPNAANQNGAGTYTFTNVPGPLDSTCGANSAVTMNIATEADYARLAWISGSAGYPAGLTLGTLVGLSDNVAFTPGQAADQPYYMLSFTDPIGGLAGATPGDQILMLEFQTTNLAGNTMTFDANTTQVNLYDNEGAGFYLNGPFGQQDTNSLAGWISADPFLASVLLGQVRVAIGLSGGGSSPDILTVNSLDILTPNAAVPEPTSILLLLTVVGITGKGIQRRLRNSRS